MTKKAPPSVQRSIRVNTEQARPDTALPSHQFDIHLPVVLRLKHRKEDIPGVTRSIGLQRIRLVTDQVLGSGLPLALQFRMGDGICYLNVVGQVISCIPSKGDPARQYIIDVQLTAMRELEQRMLQSAIEEVMHDPSARRASLLTIHGTHDMLAEEAGRLVNQKTLERSDEKESLSVKVGSDTLNSDPSWMSELKRRIRPYWEAVLQCRLIQEASVGSLSLDQMRGWILQLYPFIETFPKWIALSIARAPDPTTRGFMIDNVRIEKRHAAQWVQMAVGFGIEKDELNSVETLPEVDAITHWLWSINTQGSLAEAVSATNYAVEGVTQGIAKLTLQGFPHYSRVHGVNLDKKACAWMENHARYDELHPVQALQVMKLYTTRDLEEKVIFASRRSLEYLLMALDACYVHFSHEPGPVGVARSKKMVRSKVS